MDTCFVRAHSSASSVILYTPSPQARHEIPAPFRIWCDLELLIVCQMIAEERLRRCVAYLATASSIARTIHICIFVLEIAPPPPPSLHTRHHARRERVPRATRSGVCRAEVRSRTDTRRAAAAPATLFSVSLPVCCKLIKCKMGEERRDMEETRANKDITLILCTKRYATRQPCHPHSVATRELSIVPYPALRSIYPTR